MNIDKLNISAGTITPSTVGGDSNYVSNPFGRTINPSDEKADRLAAKMMFGESGHDRTFYNQTSDALENYTDYGIIYTPYEDMNKKLAEQQGFFEQLFNSFVMQGAIGVGLIGAAEGFTDLYDLATGAAFKSMAIDLEDNLDDGKENFSKSSEYMYRNAASKWLHEKREELNKAFPVYSTDEYSMFNGGLAHWSWYAQNIPSLWSFASFMIPSGVVTKGLSWGVKGIKGLNTASKIGKVADKATDAARVTSAVEMDNAAAHIARTVSGYREGMAASSELVEGSSRIFTGISTKGQTAELLTNGILGTYMANQTFARDIAKQKEDELRQNFKDENYYNEVIKNNPSLKEYANDKEKVIRILANRAATRDWEWNIITGIPLTSQLYAVRGWWSGFAKKGGTRGIIGAAREQAEQMANAERRAIIEQYNNSVRGKVSHFFTDRDFAWGSNFRGYWDAAWGNAVNVIGELEADYDLESNLTGKNTSIFTRIPQHFTQGRLYDAAVWGALGGVFSNKLMSAIGNAKTKYFDKVEKTEEQSRIDNVNTWDDRVVKLLGRLERIKKGQNIYVPARDNQGNPLQNPLWRGPEDTLHDRYYPDTFKSDAEQEFAFKRALNDFILDIADEAASNSNLRYLKAFLNDKYVQEAFIEKGVISQEDANSFREEVNNLLDNFESTYNTQVNRAYEIGIVPQIAQIIASENTRNVFNIRLLENLSKTKNTEIDKLINDYKENLIGTKTPEELLEIENQLRKDFQYTKDAFLIKAIRDNYRNRLNQLAKEKGIDVEVERTRLTKLVDSLENALKQHNYNQGELDSILYHARRTKQVALDENGKPKINSKGEYETFTYEDAANEYLDKRLSEMDKEIEKETFKGIIEKTKKEINSRVQQLFKEHENIYSKANDLAYIELELAELNSRLTYESGDMTNRANQIFTQIDKKAKEQIDNALKKLDTYLNKYDTDEVYDYIMGRKDNITDITEEDKADLDEAIFLIGLDDERFNSVIYDIAARFRNIKQEKQFNKVRDEVKEQNIKAYENLKSTNYTISDKDEELSPENKKHLKVGDRVVYQNKMKDPSKLVDEKDGRKSKENDEVPYDYFNQTGTIIEINPRKEGAWIDPKTGDILRYSEAENMSDEEFDKWFTDHKIEFKPDTSNANQKFNEKYRTEVEIPDTFDYIIEKDNNKFGSKIKVSSKDISHKILGSKPKRKPRTAPKKSSEPKASGTKKHPRRGKNSQNPQAAGKNGNNSSSSTGGLNVNNTTPGGIIEVGDLVNVLNDDGTVNYQGVVTKVTEDGYKIRQEGKTRSREANKDIVARDEGFIAPEESAPEEGEFDIRDYVYNLLGEGGAFYDDILDGIKNKNLLDKLEELRDTIKQHKPSVDEDDNPITISDDEWFKAVDDVIDDISKNNPAFKKSTLGDLLFVNTLEPMVPKSPDNVTELYQTAVENLIESFKNDIGTIDLGKSKVVDAIEVFRYIYNHRKNINDVNDLYTGVINTFKSLNKYNRDSGIIYSLDNLTKLSNEDLEKIVTAPYDDYNTVSQVLDEDQKISVADLINNTGSSSFEEAMQKINPSAGFDIEANNQGLHFYSKSTNGSRLYVGSLPQPTLRGSVYYLPNDGWNIDLTHNGLGVISNFLETYVNTWFVNSNGNHNNLLGILADYIALTVEERKNLNDPRVITILNNFENSNEYKAASAYYDFPTNVPRGKELVRKRLDYLRKLFQYSNGFNNKTLDFGIFKWRDKLYNSAVLLTNVANNPAGFEGRYVGLNPGKLYYGSREDRGYAQDRIGGYKNGDRNQFKLSVSDRNGFVSISGEAFPQRVPFAHKGYTFLAMPYQGAGFRNYVQAYPVSLDVLEMDNSSEAKVAKEIVSDIKDQFTQLLIENANDPTDSNFKALKSFMMKVFWNRNNWDSKTNTAYSLFRLKEDAANNSRYKFLTVTDKGDQVTLAAGNNRVIITRERVNTGSGKRFGAKTFSINGKTSAEINIVEEISKIFDNISFDININFIKHDGSRNKTFGDSLASYDANGKFVIDTGVNKYVFDSYSRFLMDNHLVTFKTKITPNGTNYIQNADDAKAMGEPTPDEISQPKIHIQVVDKSSNQPARRGTTDVSTETTPGVTPQAEIIYPDNIKNDITNDVDNILKGSSKNKGYDIAKLLIPSIDVDDADFLKALFPKKVVEDQSVIEANKYIDENGEVHYPNVVMNTSTKTLYIGNWFKGKLEPASTDAATMLERKLAVRKLIHEQLHNTLREISDTGMIAELEDVYNEYERAINKPENQSIIESIANEIGWSVEQYKKFLSDALFRDNDETHQTEMGRLEEFLIETLTNNALSKAMNALQAENVGTSKEETLWQKIMKFLLEKVLGLTINKNSLYEKEFNTFSDAFSEKITNFVTEESKEEAVVSSKNSPITSRLAALRNRISNNKQTLHSTLRDTEVISVDAFINSQPAEFMRDVQNAIDKGYIKTIC